MNNLEEKRLLYKQINQTIKIAISEGNDLQEVELNLFLENLVQRIKSNKISIKELVKLSKFDDDAYLESAEKQAIRKNGKDKYRLSEERNTDRKLDWAFAKMNENKNRQTKFKI